MKKTVVFGGTFNPPHLAHMEIIDIVSSMTDTDELLMIPTDIPPHKECAALASNIERFEMCKIATAGKEKVTVSDIEIARGGKSYTFDTLCTIRNMNPQKELAIICGGDMISTFGEWYKYKDILKIAEIIAVRRRGINNTEFDASVQKLRNEGGVIFVIKTLVTGISSTQIREKINNTEYLLKYLPRGVYEYINSNGLYGEDNDRL